MNVDYQLIKRYLDGNPATGDRAIIENWFSNLKFESDLRAKYYQYWDEMRGEEKFENYNGPAILDRIYHQLTLEELKTSKKTKKLSKAIIYFSRIAAVFLLGLITYFMISRGEYNFKKSSIALSEIYAPLGTRTNFYLPDGTTGWLNGGSSLRFPVIFKGKSRNVNLEGEAYFDVKTDPKKPFIVSGNNYRVVAHGTSFNILAYPDDQKIKFSLIEGSIQVYKNMGGKLINLAFLKPDQMLIYNRRTYSSELLNVDAEKYSLWKDGLLVFRNESFTEVIQKINRWYNVNLVIKDKNLESFTYLATFQDETLEEVLNLLKLSAPIRYRDLGRKRAVDGTFEKRTIEIYYKP